MEHEAYIKNFEFEEDYWWFKGRRKIVFTLMNKISSDSGNDVILDNGCGTGITLKKISQYKTKIGIDANDDALHYCKQRKIKNLVKGHVYDLPFNDKSFDCVLILDILEHLDEEEDALFEAHRICKNNGKIVITVPAYKFLWSGEDVVSQHKRRYVKSILRNKVEQSGFKIIKLSYFNTILMPLIYIVIIKNKLFNKKALMESDLKMLPASINRILSFILYAEASLLKLFNLPFGASIICIAKRID